jgi:hypothetical protein
MPKKGSSSTFTPRRKLSIEKERRNSDITPTNRGTPTNNGASSSNANQAENTPTHRPALSGSASTSNLDQQASTPTQRPNISNRRRAGCIFSH